MRGHRGPREPQRHVRERPTHRRATRAGSRRRDRDWRFALSARPRSGRVGSALRRRDAGGLEHGRAVGRPAPGSPDHQEVPVAALAVASRGRPAPRRGPPRCSPRSKRASVRRAATCFSGDAATLGLRVLLGRRRQGPRPSPRGRRRILARATFATPPASGAPWSRSVPSRSGPRRPPRVGGARASGDPDRARARRCAGGGILRRPRRIPSLSARMRGGSRDLRHAGLVAHARWGVVCVRNSPCAIRRGWRSRRRVTGLRARAQAGRRGGARDGSTVLITGESRAGKEGSHAPFTVPADGAPSWPSTAARSRGARRVASCSGTRRARSPGRWWRARGGWRLPTAARCSSTRLASSLRRCRSSCCGCCRSRSFTGWDPPLHAP